VRLPRLHKTPPHPPLFRTPSRRAPPGCHLNRYALGDRIGDGLSVSVNRLVVVLRLRGLLKDAPFSGPWSPPALVVELFGVQLRSTDAHGNELGGNLQAIWRATNSKLPEVRGGPSLLPAHAFYAEQARRVQPLSEKTDGSDMRLLCCDS